MFILFKGISFTEQQVMDTVMAKKMTDTKKEKRALAQEDPQKSDFNLLRVGGHDHGNKRSIQETLVLRRGDATVTDQGINFPQLTVPAR